MGVTGCRCGMEEAHSHVIALTTNMKRHRDIMADSCPLKMCRMLCV